MSVRPTINNRGGESTAAESTTPASSAICAASSCWDDGSQTELADDSVSEPSVLCEICRKAYLGVAT
jgi:hypothetical protein